VGAVREALAQRTHPRYDATGNAVCADTVTSPPRRIRWIAGPLRAPGYQISAGGRNFYAGVIARDAFNGLQLWSRPLEPAPLGAADPIATAELLAFETSTYTDFAAGNEIHVPSADDGSYLAGRSSEPGGHYGGFANRLRDQMDSSAQPACNQSSRGRLETQPLRPRSDNSADRIRRRPLIAFRNNIQISSTDDRCGLFRRDFTAEQCAAFDREWYSYPDKRFVLYWFYYYFNRHCGDLALDVTGTAPWHDSVDGPETSGPVTPALVTLNETGCEMDIIIVNGSWKEDYPCNVLLANFQVARAAGKYLSQVDRDADPLVDKEVDVIKRLPIDVTGERVSFTVPAHSIVFVRLFKSQE